MPPLILHLVLPDGWTVGGSGSVAPGNACPVITSSQSFAHALPAGEYFIRVTTARDETQAFAYQLRLGVTP
jgi:hypothetical protein